MATDRKAFWNIDPSVTYLNHGSFGPSPICVQEARFDWTRQLESQPMKFFCQRMETELAAVASQLADFVGTESKDLLLVDNATVGMNVAASAFDLKAGDEVVLTDHEYGAVERLWHRKCDQSDARVIIAELPDPIQTVEGIVEAIFEKTSARTRAIVVSHITSQTATVLPVKQICERARQQSIPVVIDGPHAVAMLPLDIRSLGCAFYTASCHKWLCGPFGSGFLYADAALQGKLKPQLTSWGSSIAGHEASWRDEFNWIGTRDPAAWLALPHAIRFLHEQGLDCFREHGHRLVQTARHRAELELDARCLVPDSLDWYGTMITLSIPKPESWAPAQHGKIDVLQRALRDEHSIEIPVFSWKGHRCLRVSAHLYNSMEDIDRLFDAVKACKDW